MIEESGYLSGKIVEYAYKYDADGLILKKTEYYDGIIRESTEYQANGVTVRKDKYTRDGELSGGEKYDASGRLAKEIEMINKAGGWVDYTYDAYGNCTMIAHYDPTNGRSPDGLLGWTEYEWGASATRHRKRPSRQRPIPRAIRRSRRSAAPRPLRSAACVGLFPGQHDGPCLPVPCAAFGRNGRNGTIFD